jgi:Mrp family chromosome partitioning ATPase
MLRAMVMQRMRANGWNTLAVVSPARDEGKTFVATNLAIALAAEPDQTALLVDLDLQEPSVHLLFGVMPEAGVGDCLAGRAPVSSALLALEVYPGLVLLPGKHSVAQSSELLGGQRARALFREIKGRYLNRVVIYDLPPMLTSDDALVFAPQADAVLVVIGENRTERADLIRSIELLRDVPVLGTVLNGVQATVDPTAAR